jgi:2-polyprenyl-6-methoxyphenol hydroxylase-like FAD-dependent oxidoreductase
VVAPGRRLVTRPAGILVAGAGPAGLALALQAHDHGADVRIVERRHEAGRPSRALIVHPRTLEVLRPLGVTQALLAKGDIAPTADLHLGRRVVRVRLGGLALPDTAFPHLSLIRQMDVETVLAQALADRGIEVERGTELAGVHDGTDGVQAVLRSGGSLTEARFGFVVGCDGPSSTVRSQAGIGWPGRPYPVEVVLADAELTGDLADDGAAQVVTGRRGLVFAFRLGERATWRLLATRPAGADRVPCGQPGPPVLATELQALLDDAHLGARITHLAWSARVRVQHRVAGRFRQGRLYLAGDAAHAYSPATGQGMNAAIQDAANLGWKLAATVQGWAPPGLLDTYHAERHPVGRQVLRRSGALLRLFTLPPALVSARNVLASAVTTIPFLAKRPAGALSGVSICYPVPRGAHPLAGKRVADLPLADGRRLYEALRGGRFLLAASPGALPADAATGYGDRVEVAPVARACGTVALIRPDAYIAWAAAGKAAIAPQIRGGLARWCGSPARPAAQTAGR